MHVRPLDMHIKSGRKLKNLRTHRTDLYSMFFLFLHVNQTQFGGHMKADYDAAFWSRRSKMDVKIMIPL